jgi:predicted DsbA family dithiol-disulfide isomerase
VEVFEFACPYCAMIAPAMAELVEKYRGQPVRIVPKQFVIHPKTATEPALAVCAANRMGAYERYAEALWAKSWKKGERLSLDEAVLERTALIDLAATLGLDRDRFEAELSGEACRAKLDRDRAELAAAGVRGTPSIFVNGVAYAGPRTVEALSQAIDRARRQVR